MSNVQNRRKILHIITSSANGGMESYIGALICEQFNNGYNVVAAAIPHSPIWSFLQSNSVRVLPLQKSSYFSIVNIFKIRSYLRREKSEIVHIHSGRDVWLGVESCFGLHIPLVLSLYMFSAPKRDFLHRFIYSRIDAFGSSSEQINHDIIKHFDAQSESIFLLKYGRHLPTDEQIQQLRNQGRQHLGLKENEVFVLSLCRIDRQKGITEYAESMKILDERGIDAIRYGIVGSPTQSGSASDGSPIYEDDAMLLHSWLLEFIRKNHLENKCDVFPHQKEYMHLIAAADIFVLASYGEMYSLAIVEAMSCGAVVVSTNTGGAIEQIGYSLPMGTERGLLVPPKNAAALADAIQNIADNREKMLLLGKNAKKWARKNHSFEAALSQVDVFYEFALQKRNLRHR